MFPKMTGQADSLVLLVCHVSLGIAIVVFSIIQLCLSTESCHKTIPHNALQPRGGTPVLGPSRPLYRPYWPNRTPEMPHGK